MSYKRFSIEPAADPATARTRPKGRRVGHPDGHSPHSDFPKRKAGTGADISFSEYDAFALLNGLRIMGHGWPQGFAVSVMRRVRPDLEKQHARILRQDPDKLFDEQAIRASARPGDIAVTNIDPVFLTLASKEKLALDEGQTPQDLEIKRSLFRYLGIAALQKSERCAPHSRVRRA
jgi:hypothetical protein